MAIDQEVQPQPAAAPSPLRRIWDGIEAGNHAEVMAGVKEADANGVAIAPNVNEMITTWLSVPPQLHAVSEDRALAKILQPSREGVRPNTADASSTPRKGPMQPSTLGFRLGRLDLAKTGESALGSSRGGTSKGAQEPASTPRAAAVNSELTKRISRKYKAEVVKSEQERLKSYVPLDQRAMVKPDTVDLARSLKSDLDTIMKKSGAEVVPWDSSFRADDMQKRMQWLGGNDKNERATEELDKMGGKYEGAFLYGLRHGDGKHEYKGEVYTGGFMWDKRHGAGTLTQSDGTTISGTWKEGKLNGLTTITDVSGAVMYEGEFKDGKRHGIQGRQTFPNGDVYNGGWKAGLQHDRGIYYFATGDVLEAIWNEGRYDGAAMLHCADGTKSRRVYRDGVLVTSQDYQIEKEKFNKEMSRDVMLKHTTQWEFPKHSFID
eukprot:TRINITY_DN4622_c0_g1_i1.p1 TRINITY_DN4622_c0_g1~~TRINITY_DN4622_c0_g1_i1.p1  ORF type:complete len:434 (+),score=96.73 TRINITY_DN4622_c0_g1_i1:81-1382(+)